MYTITCNGLNFNVDETELIRVLTDELRYSAGGAELIKDRIDSGGSVENAPVRIVKM